MQALSKVEQALLPVLFSLTLTTLHRFNVHFIMTALENVKIRQVLIVSSPCPQRKQLSDVSSDHSFIASRTMRVYAVRL